MGPTASAQSSAGVSKTRQRRAGRMMPFGFSVDSYVYIEVLSDTVVLWHLSKEGHGHERPYRTGRDQRGQLNKGEPALLAPGSGLRW